MKKLNIMFWGLMLIMAVSFPVFADENNVSKLIVQGEGQGQCHSGYGDHRLGSGDV